MFADFLYILTWWIVLFAVGNFFLPLTSYIFSFFFDRGYIFSKIIGMVLISYTIWVLASFKLLPFSTTSLFLILATALIANMVFAFKKSAFLFDKKILSIFLFEELLFLVALAFWSYIRAHEPSIHGLEKFMDFGFVNSILRTQYFPPTDMWLPPLPINYYYFGHLITAVLTKISFLDPATTYNLMLATLFAFAFTGAFSLGGNLLHLYNLSLPQPIQNSKIYILFAAFLSAFLVALGGNLHTIYIFFQNYVPPENPVPFWQLPLQINLQGYWYPNATRFIPNTIHEFPLYSFVVSDLHGHVLNIPMVLLSIAFTIKFFFQKQVSWYFYLAVGLLIAIFLMTNVLDGPIYLLFLATILFAKYYQTEDIKKSVLQTAKNLSIILVGAITFSLPFWISFTPFASGVGVMCAPKFLTDVGKIGPLLFEADHCNPTPLWMFPILWGFFYFAVIGFIRFIAKKTWNNLSKFNKVDYFSLAIAFVATILILIPEFFYVKDIYPTHYRANTVFKFGYQAFILLGLIGGYMISRILSLRPLRLKFFAFGMLLFCFVAIYPYFAINSYYGGLKTYIGLDGLQYLSNLYPTDYQAILWIRENIDDQPVILEAQGDSYTDYARVSANTGLPTVVGWPVHEWLWRGSYEEAGKRSSDVTTLYQSTDLELTKQLLEKYKVSYVFIGVLEREKYPSLDITKFEKLGRVVYQSGDTVIFKVE